MSSDESQRAYVEHLNQLRDLTGRAIQQSVKRNVWDQVDWGDGVSECVLDLGPGSGYHFAGLDADRKRQVIALERNPVMRDMLGAEHPEVSIAAGSWNNLEKVLGGRLDGITTITGFNILQYIKPEELGRLLDQVQRRPNIRKLLFINDLAPMIHWAASKNDYQRVEGGGPVGIGAADIAFTSTEAVDRACQKCIQALSRGAKGFSVTPFSEWSRIDSATANPTQREAQRQEYFRTMGSPQMVHPSVRGPSDLAVFRRFPSLPGVHLCSNVVQMQSTPLFGGVEQPLPPGMVKEIIKMWGASAVRR